MYSKTKSKAVCLVKIKPKLTKVCWMNMSKKRWTVRYKKSTHKSTKRKLRRSLRRSWRLLSRLLYNNKKSISIRMKLAKLRSRSKRCDKMLAKLRKTGKSSEISCRNLSRRLQSMKLILKKWRAWRGIWSQSTWMRHSTTNKSNTKKPFEKLKRSHINRRETRAGQQYLRMYPAHPKPTQRSLEATILKIQLQNCHSRRRMRRRSIWTHRRSTISMKLNDLRMKRGNKKKSGAKASSTNSTAAASTKSSTISQQEAHQTSRKRKKSKCRKSAKA